MSWLYDMVSQASTALGLDTPHIYVVNNSEPNAYVMNIEKPVFVIHSELIKLLSREEILFVIGNELGHIKCRHMVTRTVSLFLFFALGNVIPEKFERFFTGFAQLSLFKWFRETEVSADRVGLLFVQDEEIASKALIRLLLGLRAEEEDIRCRRIPKATKAKKRESSLQSGKPWSPFEPGNWDASIHWHSG